MANHQFLQQLGIFAIPGFLTPEECAHWRGVAQTIGGHAAKVYRDEGAQVDEEHRRNLEVVVKDDPVRAETEQRILALRPSLEQHFGVELDEIDTLSCLVYREGDFFRMHADAVELIGPRRKDEPPALARRRVSLVTFLNAPGSEGEPYEGGNLQLYGLMKGAAAEGFGFPVDAEPGLMVAFPSSMQHEVTPVISGKRYTLVTWFLCREPRRETEPETLGGS